MSNLLLDRKLVYDRNLNYLSSTETTVILHDYSLTCIYWTLSFYLWIFLTFK